MKLLNLHKKPQIRKFATAKNLNSRIYLAAVVILYSKENVFYQLE